MPPPLSFFCSMCDNIASSKPEKGFRNTLDPQRSCSGKDVTIVKVPGKTTRPVRRASGRQYFSIRGIGHLVGSERTASIVGVEEADPQAV